MIRVILLPSLSIPRVAAPVAVSPIESGLELLRTNLRRSDDLLLALRG